jgi:hypothetical protein
MKHHLKLNTLLLALAMVFMVACNNQQSKTTNNESDKLPIDSVRAIAKEVYIYAYPVIDAYRVQYAYFVDTANVEFKAPLNQIKNIARVFTPEDKAVQTPNSDTPYSLLGMDLRAEPVVIIVPKIEQERYFSIQLVDSYTFNFNYIGSRTTGNNGGAYLVAGPGWKGDTPKGVDKVIRSETELAMAIFRTQLFNSGDLDNVKRVQAGYKVMQLSSFLKTAPPAPAAPIDFIKPLTPDLQKSSLAVFNILNFILQFCPANPSEKELMARFAKIGIVPGRIIDTAKISTEIKAAMKQGIQEAWSEDFQGLKRKIDAGEVKSGDLFGTREYLKNNYLYRMGAAILGIYGNSIQEAMYPIYATDADGDKLDGSANRYTLHFAKNELPQVNAFWSLTMYELPSSLLVANPLKRYLLNSPMMPTFKKDKDGGLTFFIQSKSPDKEKESNWLPAPNGPFMCVLRLYWPKQKALDGTWKNPQMQKKS